MAQFRQPDFSRGDPNTLGGYAAVHDRPAAFEGADGFSYSVEILAGQAENGLWEAYLFFVKWARIGSSSPEGHLESAVLAEARTEADAIAQVGAMPLSAVKSELDTLIAQRDRGKPRRKWWDAMRDDADAAGGDSDG